VAECWDAVSISHNFNSLNDHSWKTLRPALVKITDDNVVPPPITSSGNVTVTVKRKAEASASPEHASRPSSTVVTPAAKASVTSITSAKPSSADGRRISLSPKPPIAMEVRQKKAKYEERQGAGTVVATFQPELGNGQTLGPSETPRCSIVWRDTDEFQNVTEAYRHLFTPPAQKAQALEAHLNKMSKLFMENYAFGEGDLAPLEAVGLPRQEVVCCLGRICSSVSVSSLTQS
jgi:hypothetical protein